MYFKSKLSYQAYCYFTIHYITPNVTLSSHLLKTKEFSDSHSAENVAVELRSILDQWEVSTENVVAATTNTCANMVRAIQINNWLNVPCFSHTLNLAVEKFYCCQNYQKPSLVPII